MKYLFISLFFFTPIILNSANSEIFEIPKTHFLYAITLLILGNHLLHVIRGQKPFIILNRYLISFLVFVIAIAISTFFSIDPHTSIYGYYTRPIGGLLSLLSFFIIFFTLQVYHTPKLSQQIIITSLVSGFIVATYAILQHFGVDRHLWVQDVQSRVFSTLGQPNWLAAYLCVLIPISLHLALNSTKKLSTFIFFLISFVFYLALIFTKSRSGFIANFISLIIYYLFTFKTHFKSYLFYIFPVTFSFLLILINNPVKDYFLPATTSNTTVTNTPLSSINITSSEDLRKIVWQGALTLWQQFPLVGTGPETFAYSYYWVRPISHNTTSEWDFLYNKAHNEYLNYLATTGIIGFITYLILIIFSLRALRHQPHFLSAYVSLLITNFFGFSVATTSLYFFTLPVLINSFPTTTTKPRKILFILMLPILILSIQNVQLFIADTAYARANAIDSQQQYSDAYQLIQVATAIDPREPQYLIKQAEIESKLALSAKNHDLIEPTLRHLSQALNISTFNVNYWKISAQIYYYLSGLDKEYYFQSIESLQHALKLAPTDAKLYFLLGEFYQNISQTDLAITNYQQALKLKSNYDHAAYSLAKIYISQKKFSQAIPLLELTLQIAPNNTQAKLLLDSIQPVP